MRVVVVGMKKILVLEDDRVQIDLVSSILKDDYSLVFANRIEDADDLLLQHSFDMFMIDLGLPDGNGLNFCTKIRNDKTYQKIPIFIISSNTDVYTKIASLELGADDYITKPVHPIELKTKVKNKFKRLEDEMGASNFYKTDKFHIDYEKRRLLIELKDNEVREIELTNKEFDLFALLAKNEGRVFSRQDLIDKAWSKNINITDRVVDTHIASVRKKIAPYGDYISSEYGIGYKFKIPKESSKK
jgi:DNA-binding response OmpR family regulator